MRKKSFNTRNAVAKLFKPVGGMCNTISGEYIKDNQACSISGVIYNEDKNSFQGSYTFSPIYAYNHLDFKRIFNVSFKDRQCLFGAYTGGIYDITNGKGYDIEKGVVPSDIIYNNDGLFIASSYNIYHLKKDESIVKITFSLSPFSWQRLSARQSKNILSNSLFYFNSRLYFSDSRGVGFMIEGSNEVTLLSKESLNLDFCVCNNQLFAVNAQEIYIINNNEIVLYENIEQHNLPVRFTTAYNNELLALSKTASGYEVIAFDTGLKTIKKYKTNLTKGKTAAGFKYMRVCDNNIYFLINEVNKSQTSVSSSLYKVKFDGSVFNISETLYENYKSTLYLQHIVYINDSIFCYYSAFERLANSEKTIQLFEYAYGRLVHLDYVNPPDNLLSSATIAVNNNRLYAANNSGIYYVDIVPDKEYIPCLLLQNGRLCVPQGSSLYFSGAGDFYNWSWGSDIDALFVEIGYKDGGKIIYAVVVLDSIIVFKDNGSIYRLGGSYPNWVISKLGEVDTLTSRAVTYGSQVIFGSSSGIKKISATEYYGDFFLTDYQYSMQDKNVTDVSLCNRRNNIIFSSKDYIFEYSNVLRGFYIYDYNNKNFIQIIEIFNPDKTYTTYALDNTGLLHIQSSYELNSINVIYKEIKSNLNMVIKAVVVYTPELENDKVFDLTINGNKYTFTLKSGKNRHKYFITKKVNKLQIEIAHKGDFFIDNIFVEYSQIGE